jgi:hypothetical protein
VTAGETANVQRDVQIGSERSFGIVFCVVFALVGIWPWLFGGQVRLWSLALAAGFLAAGFLAPALLTPLNRLWFRFGLLLHAVINPVIMALLFFVAFVPMAALLRLMGKDLLRLKRDKAAESYWIARDPPGPAPGSMSKQF